MPTFYGKDFFKKATFEKTQIIDNVLLSNDRGKMLHSTSADCLHHDFDEFEFEKFDQIYNKALEEDINNFDRIYKEELNKNGGKLKPDPPPDINLSGYIESCFSGDLSSPNQQPIQTINKPSYFDYRNPPINGNSFFVITHNTNNQLALMKSPDKSSFINASNLIKETNSLKTVMSVKPVNHDRLKVSEHSKYDAAKEIVHKINRNDLSSDKLQKNHTNNAKKDNSKQCSLSPLKTFSDYLLPSSSELSSSVENSQLHDSSSPSLLVNSCQAVSPPQSQFLTFSGYTDTTKDSSQLISTHSEKKSQDILKTQLDYNKADSLITNVDYNIRDQKYETNTKLHTSSRLNESIMDLNLLTKSSNSEQSEDIKHSQSQLSHHNVSPMAPTIKTVKPDNKLNDTNDPSHDDKHKFENIEQLKISKDIRSVSPQSSFTINAKPNELSFHKKKIPQGFKELSGTNLLIRQKMPTSQDDIIPEGFKKLVGTNLLIRSHGPKPKFTMKKGEHQTSSLTYDKSNMLPTVEKEHHNDNLPEECIRSVEFKEGNLLPASISCISTNKTSSSSGHIISHLDFVSQNSISTDVKPDNQQKNQQIQAVLTNHENCLSEYQSLNKVQSNKLKAHNSLSEYDVTQLTSLPSHKYQQDPPKDSNKLFTRNNAIVDVEGCNKDHNPDNIQEFAIKEKNYSKKDIAKSSNKHFTRNNDVIEILEHCDVDHNLDDKEESAMDGSIKSVLSQQETPSILSTKNNIIMAVVDCDFDHNLDFMEEPVIEEEIDMNHWDLNYLNQKPKDLIQDHEILHNRDYAPMSSTYTVATAIETQTCPSLIYTKKLNSINGEFEKHKKSNIKYQDGCDGKKNNKEAIQMVDKDNFGSCAQNNESSQRNELPQQEIVGQAYQLYETVDQFNNPSALTNYLNLKENDMSQQYINQNHQKDVKSILFPKITKKESRIPKSEAMFSYQGNSISIPDMADETTCYSSRNSITSQNPQLLNHPLPSFYQNEAVNIPLEASILKSPSRVCALSPGLSPAYSLIEEVKFPIKYKNASSSPEHQYSSSSVVSKPLPKLNISINKHQIKTAYNSGLSDSVTKFMMLRSKHQNKLSHSPQKAAKIVVTENKADTVTKVINCETDEMGMKFVNRIYEYCYPYINKLVLRNIFKDSHNFIKVEKDNLEFLLEESIKSNDKEVCQILKFLIPLKHAMKLSIQLNTDAGLAYLKGLDCNDERFRLCVRDLSNIQSEIMLSGHKTNKMMKLHKLIYQEQGKCLIILSEAHHFKSQIIDMITKVIGVDVAPTISFKDHNCYVYNATDITPDFPWSQFSAVIEFNGVIPGINVVLTPFKIKHFILSTTIPLTSFSASTFSDFRIVAYSSLSYKVLQRLETIHNFTILQRTSEGIYEKETIIIDEITCVVIIENLNDIKMVKVLSKLFIEISLKYQMMNIIFDVSTCHSPELFSLIFASTAHFNSDVLKIKIFYCLNVDEICSRIMKIAVFAKENISPSWKSTELWLKRTWLTEEESNHEKLLTLFPWINSFAAQIILTTHTLGELMSLTLQECLDNLSVIPAEMVMSFYKAVHTTCNPPSPVQVDLNKSVQFNPNLTIQNYTQVTSPESTPPYQRTSLKINKSFDLGEAINQTYETPKTSSLKSINLIKTPMKPHSIVKPMFSRDVVPEKMVKRKVIETNQHSFSFSKRRKVLIEKGQLNDKHQTTLYIAKQAN